MGEYLGFREIRLEFLRCRLKNKEDYYGELPKHPDWPPDPTSHYADKWPGWERFLRINHDHCFLEFTELVVNAKINNVVTMADYFRLCKSIYTWPFNPEKVYKNWPGEKEFLRQVKKAKIPVFDPDPEGDIPKSLLWSDYEATA